jgi:hypothetical protein
VSFTNDTPDGLTKLEVVVRVLVVLAAVSETPHQLAPEGRSGSLRRREGLQSESQ